MRVFAELLSTPTADTPGTCVQVHFDDKRYILGQIAEGTQRWLTERKSRGGKLAEVFITGRTEWATVGGLIGFILTIGDQNKDKAMSKITVHGGDNILHMVATTRSYVLRQQMMLAIDEQIEGNQPFKDRNVTVQPLHVRPSSDPLSPFPPSPEPSTPEAGNKRQRDETMTKEERLDFLARKVEDMFFNEQQSLNYAHGEAMSKMNEVGEPPMKRGRVPGADGPQPYQARNKTLPPSTPSNVAMSYIMILHDHRGKFLPKVAKSLGVRPGPAYSKLAAGEAVTTPDGRVVQPSEVMEPTIPGTGIAVCDLPDASYIDDFITKPEWNNVEDLQKRISCFFWIVGDGVHEDVRLQEFISRFPKAAHVVSARDVCPNPIRFNGAAKFTQRLNYLDPIAFPILQSSETPLKQAPEGTIAARSGMRRIIEPAWSWEENFDRVFDPEAALQSLRDLGPSFDQVVAETHASFADSPVPVETWPGSDVEVITLGTGSSLPSRYRNVSGTVLRIPNVGTIVLDCGEDTIGQLRRLLPDDEYTALIRDIKAIYISHLHADHHLGAVSLIKARTRLLRSSQEANKIFIVAPRRFHDFLDEYSSVEKIFDSHANKPIYIPLENLILSTVNPTPVNPSWPAYQHLLAALSLESWRSATAMHCQDSFTTALTFTSGFKVAYSGDTRPTGRFVNLGRDSTLLIHEATFDDELIAEAVAKKHSTISEAVKAGKDMNAKVTCLTHFSQRYPKKPNMAAGEDDGMKVVYAFDCMRFKVGEAGRFRRLQRGLEEVYKDVDEDAKKEEEEEDGEQEEEEDVVMRDAAEAKNEKRSRSQAKQERRKKRQQPGEDEKGQKRGEEEEEDAEVTMEELMQSPKKGGKGKKKGKAQGEMGKQDMKVMEGRRARLKQLDDMSDVPGQAA